MTGLQVIANIVLAILAFVFMRWLFSFVPTLPDVFSFLASLVVAFVVFATNTAARLGIN